MSELIPEEPSSPPASLQTLPEVINPAWLCTLWEDLNAFKYGTGNTPKLTYGADDQDEFLRGRSFSPYTQHWDSGPAGLADEPHRVLRFIEHVQNNSVTAFIVFTEETSKRTISIMPYNEENPGDRYFEACGDILLFLREFLDKQLYPRDGN